jgi:hypothetical protein
MVDKSAEGRSMRDAPAERLLRLPRHLAATRTGLTLDEMAPSLKSVAGRLSGCGIR